MRHHIATLTAAAVLGTIPSGASAHGAATAGDDTAGAPTTQEPLTDLIRRVRPSVVRITTDDALGTGFFVGRRLVLTAAHVTFPNRRVEVRSPGGGHGRGVVVWIDRNRDIALIRTVFSEPPLPLATAGIPAGTSVTVLGYPGGLPFTVTRGIVSGAHRRIFGRRDLLQIDAPVSVGSSGGPVLDEHGRVVAVIDLGLASLFGELQNLNFGVSSRTARAVLAAYRRNR